jgi:hypothetical protein
VGYLDDLQRYAGAKESNASGKMSQNRNDRDYKTIITELEKLNEGLCDIIRLD